MNVLPDFVKVNSQTFSIYSVSASAVGSYYILINGFLNDGKAQKTSTLFPLEISSSFYAIAGPLNKNAPMFSIDLQDLTVLQGGSLL